MEEIRKKTYTKRQRDTRGQKERLSVCVCVCERERERETDREIEREAEDRRQTGYKWKKFANKRVT